jgi:hypothetical protein
VQSARPTGVAQKSQWKQEEVRTLQIVISRTLRNFCIIERYAARDGALARLLTARQRKLVVVLWYVRLWAVIGQSVLLVGHSCNGGEPWTTAQSQGVIITVSNYYNWYRTKMQKIMLPFWPGNQSKRFRTQSGEH